MKNLTGLYKHQRDHTRGGSHGGSSRARPSSWLTVAQRRVIERAKNDPLGLGIIEYHGHGFGKRAWHGMMKTLCENGYFKPYVHGGYELTERGRSTATDS